MEKLNHECIAEIFQYLPIVDRIRYERVCKLWKEASESSWRSFRSLNIKDLLLENTNLFKESRTEYNKNIIFSKFLKRIGTYLRNVCLKKTSNPLINSLNLSHVILYLIIYCENIVELSITGENLKVPDTLFGPLFFRNKGLKSLEINSCKLNGTCLLYVSSEKLEKLILKNVIITKKKLPIHFKNLKIFKLINDELDDSYSDEDDDEDYDTNILKLLSESLINSGPNITELVIKKSSNNNIDTDRMIKNLFSSMENLNRVELGKFDINNDIIMSLPKISLETMIFESCSMDFTESLETFKNLKNLGMRYMNIHKDLIEKLSLCKSIKILDLSSIFEFDISLIELFYDLQNLEVLDLSEINDEKIDDEFLKIIGKNCKLLKAINLCDFGSEIITDDGLSYITSIESLEILLIDQIANVTGKPLSFMTNIKELYCCNNVNLENDGLIELLKTAPYLKILDVCCNKKINNKLIDAAIETINVRQQNLEIYIIGSGIDSSAFDNIPTSIILKNEKIYSYPVIFYDF